MALARRRFVFILVLLTSLSSRATFGQTTTKSEQSKTPFTTLPINSPSSTASSTSAEELGPTPRSRDSLFAELATDVAELEKRGNILKRVVKLVTPSVVHLESLKSEPGSLRPSIEEAGSGVVIKIEDRYYILTNRHVIRDAALRNIKIRLSGGRLLKPVEVWADSETDVAVIEVQSEKNLVTARIGTSGDLEIGDFVLAVGSPFGLSHSVSYGIISAKGRRDLELGNDEIRLQDFLQTDAAINPGNSGGPLLNLRGEVVGINTAIASNSGGNEGVSFAIPMNLVMFTATQLITNGEVEHAYIGVTLDSTFDDDMARRLGLKQVRGALVRSVRPKSPAFFANLKTNDIIIGFDGQLVEDDDHLVNLVSLTPVNDQVALKVIRQRKVLELQVKVGRRSTFESKN